MLCYYSRIKNIFIGLIKYQLYGLKSGKSWSERKTDEKFDQSHQRLIDERKEEIKAEEEDEQA